MNESNYSRAALSVRGLLADYERKATTPSQVIKSIVRRIEENGRPEIWTLLRSTSALNARAAELDALLAAEGPSLFKRQPLFGVPFAVKDNVDVAGLPTTAACKEFAYVAQATAFAVQRLLDAGAILIGKTNLDQFATGLVGTRSPFGAVRQVEFPERVSGGSSSGSAAAVAAGCVAFSLGTDTAGSGRVPAGFNELVGLKPTLGLVSKRGVVPACRSLDTLSIFTHDVADAWHVLSQMAGFDALDSYSRQVPALGLLKDTPRVGIPDVAGFFDDSAAEQAFAATLESLAKGLSITPSPVPFAPLKQVSALLYDGPWVAERRAALGDFFETHHDAIHPVVAKVIGKADRFSAVDAFIAQYELADLKRQAEQMFRDIDVLIVPTTPTHPLIADVLENPIELNSQLGLYTNFVNLLDLCALAVPCLRRGDGLPAGITLIAPAGADHRLAVLGARIQALFHATSAGGGIEYQPLPFDEPTVTLAVVGAHLRGQPLNWQLLEAGARFVEAVETTSDYQLFALANTTPPKPGLARVASKGKPIAVELWEVPVRQFGALVARVPAPLGIGTVQVAGGAFVKSFICEPWAIEPASGARDITEFGGWLAYLDSLDDQAQ